MPARQSAGWWLEPPTSIDARELVRKGFKGTAGEAQKAQIKGGQYISVDQEDKVGKLQLAVVRVH